MLLSWTGTLVLLPTNWNSADTQFLSDSGILTRIFGSGSGYPVLSQADISNATVTNPRIMLDSGVDLLLINALVPSVGVNVVAGGNTGSGATRSIYAATILGSRFTDGATLVNADDALIKFEDNRTFARGTSFDITSAIPTFTAPAAITQYRSQIAGYSATQVQNGIVVVRDSLGANAENNPVFNSGRDFI